MSDLTVTVLGWCESVTVRLSCYADRLDTYVQIKAGAARWRAGAGRAPTKTEMQRLRALSEPLADWERELICLICGSSCCHREHDGADA